MIDSNANEQRIHLHLEQHPHLLVAPRYADPPVVISKPPLGADYRPDFAFFWHHSGGEFVELVEIEAPSLHIFTAKDEFSREFDHALQQLSDWTSWVARHSDEIGRFTEVLFDQGLTASAGSYQYIQTRLVAGRRVEIEVNGRRKLRWQQRQDENRAARSIRTWDGFIESLPVEALDSYHNWTAIRCYRYRSGKLEEVGVS